MSQLFTLKEIADKVAHLDGRSAKDASDLHQRLRYLFQTHGVPLATDSKGPRGAWRFGLGGLAKVRLLSILMDLNFSSAALKESSEGLDVVDYDETSQAISGLHYAIPGILDGEDWEVRIRLSRRLATGALEARTRIVRQDVAPVDPVVLLFESAKGLLPTGQITISANSLLLPLGVDLGTNG